MTALPGDIVPDFSQRSTQGRIDFHDWNGWQAATPYLRIVRQPASFAGS